MNSDERNKAIVQYATTGIFACFCVWVVVMFVHLLECLNYSWKLLP